MIVEIKDINNQPIGAVNLDVREMGRGSSCPGTRAVFFEFEVERYTMTCLIPVQELEAFVLGLLDNRAVTLSDIYGHERMRAWKYVVITECLDERKLFEVESAQLKSFANAVQDNL